MSVRVQSVLNSNDFTSLVNWCNVRGMTISEGIRFMIRIVLDKEFFDEKR